MTNHLSQDPVSTGLSVGKLAQEETSKHTTKSAQHDLSRHITPSQYFYLRLYTQSLGQESGQDTFVDDQVD